MVKRLLKVAIALSAIFLFCSSSMMLAQTPSSARWLQQIGFSYDSTSKEFTICLEWETGLVDNEHPLAEKYNIYRSMIGHEIDTNNFDLVGSIISNDFADGLYKFSDKVPSQGAYFYYVQGYYNDFIGDISPIIQAFAPTSYCVNLDAPIIDFKSFPPTIAIPGELYKYKAFAQHRSPRVQGWVRYTLLEGPEQMVIDNLSGLLQWTLPQNAQGDYYVKIKATSDEDSRAESIQEWNIRIATTDEQISIPNSINEGDNLQLTFVSPNPVLDYLQIQTTKASEKIEIYSSLGLKVLETKWKERIDVSGLLPGVYFMRVGEKTGKFVKI